VVSFDRLAGYAIELFGPPLTCEGSVTTEFDGMKFGVVRLGFAGGASFQVETMPPEMSVVTLRTSSGFDDEDSARGVLEEYSANVGLAIDWAAQTVTREGDERVHTSWDPNAGLNGSASFIFLEDTLIALRFSLGL
jgi:hypothetical protein